MKKLLFAVMCGTLASCANWEAHQVAQESKYVGKLIDALYDEYGVPVGIAPKSDGGRFYEFRKYRGAFLCTANVTTNSSGRIVKVKTGGQNGCITPL